MLFRSAKEIALMSIMTALLIAGQLVFAAVQGVEIVTVLLLSFCVAFGVRRGMVVATAFSLMRCLLFGFFPNVVVLYLVYYNLFALAFGLLGKAAAKLPVSAYVAVLAVSAAVMTCCFTLFDDLLTPWMLGYTEKSARVYFYASLPVLALQPVCSAVTVALLWLPLSKVFSMVRFTRKDKKRYLSEQDFTVLHEKTPVSEQDFTLLRQENPLQSSEKESIIGTAIAGGEKENGKV